MVPKEGRAREPWELREVLLDRSERESPPTGVRHPSPEWRFITEDTWGRGGEKEEGEKERRREGEKERRREGRRKERKGRREGRRKERKGRRVEEEEAACEGDIVEIPAI